MQALAWGMAVTLFGFEGVDIATAFLEGRNHEGERSRVSIKFKLACFFFQGEVCTFSSAGRAPDSLIQGVKGLAGP